MKKRVILTLLVLLLGTMLGCTALFARGAKEGATGQPSATAKPAAVGKYSWIANWYETPTASQMGIAKFSESPALAARVKAGELPPVEQRLPKDPLVIQPLEEKGKYGGTLRVARMGPTDWGDMHRGVKGFLFRADPSTGMALPFLAKGYEISSNNTQLTYFLREGARWSDGQPFTSEDIMWNYTYRIADPDVAGWNGGFEADGKLALFEKVDDYTVKITFAAPMSLLKLTRLLNWYGMKQSDAYTPAHYMKKYHKKFNAEIEKEAKAEGYDSWVGYLEARNAMNPQQAYTKPEMGAWTMQSVSPQKKVQVRNPYYWAVDTQGNQLPYIDTVEAVYFSDKQVAILSMMQGKIDIGGRLMDPADFAVYKQSEQAGNYTVLEWQDTKNTRAGYRFNLTHKDPVLRKIFQDKRFRQAMSVAINREEINQFAFQGLATPMQFTIDSGASFYDEAWARAYAEYDPAKAKQMLEEIGLKDTDGDGWRERSDGKILGFDMLVAASSVLGTMGMTISELVADNWRDVGVKINLRQITQDLDEQRSFANEMDMTIFPSEGDLETRVPFRVYYDNESYFGYAMLWEDWLDYQDWVMRGKKGDPPPQGEEPPKEIKDFVALWDRWINSLDKDTYNKLGKEVWSYMAENVGMIGTVGKAIRPILINNRLVNVPQKMPFSFETYLWVPTTPAQWFIKE